VCYGHGEHTEAIEINAREFSSVVRKKLTTHLFDLALDGSKDYNTIIKEIQPHVLKRDTFLHIDFQHVNMNEKVIVHCPVEIIGIASGVKDGGILEHPVREVSIECMPHMIPEKVIVDVSALKIGQSLHIRDLVVVGGVFKDSPEEVVAVVSLPGKASAAGATEASAQASA
jgi:large subunit ribosomal protein L25